VAYPVDTNVLVRLAIPADPRHLSERLALEALADDNLYWRLQTELGADSFLNRLSE